MRPDCSESAIADPGPVVFVENKSIYFRREPIADPGGAPAPIPLGEANVLRSGSST